jgi:hypothetical protein
MRRWLLVCWALAACAGPRSTPTPPAGLDAEGFGALVERVAAGAHRFELFGGKRVTELPMQMTWHHLGFEPGTQVGAGGVVMAKLRGGRIERWREDQTESSLSFEEFSAATRF